MQLESNENDFATNADNWSTAATEAWCENSDLKQTNQSALPLSLPDLQLTDRSERNPRPEERCWPHVRYIAPLRAAQNNFEAIDTNKDGKLTAEEITWFTANSYMSSAEKRALNEVASRVKKLEELSNDEFGDENSGVTMKDLQEAVAQRRVVEFANDSFDALDKDKDGHVTKDEIDQRSKSLSGVAEYSPGAQLELMFLSRVRKMLGKLEEANNDEFGDENSGFTRNDLTAYETKAGLDARPVPQFGYGWSYRAESA